MDDVAPLYTPTGRLIKRYCPQGHDKWVVGVFPERRQCRRCKQQLTARWRREHAAEHNAYQRWWSTTTAAGMLTVERKQLRKRGL